MNCSEMCLKDILLNRDLNIASGEAETSLLRRLNTVANKSN